MEENPSPANSPPKIMQNGTSFRTADGRKRRFHLRNGSGAYHVRFEHNGKAFLRSLRTSVLHVARIKAKCLIDSILADEEYILKSKIAKLLPKSIRRRYASQFRHLLGMQEPAIYVLLDKGKAIYVGKTQCLIKRLGGRHEYIDQCDEILYLPTPIEDLDCLEREMIMAFQPQLNKTFGRRVVAAKVAAKAVTSDNLQASKREIGDPKSEILSS